MVGKDQNGGAVYIYIYTSVTNSDESIFENCRFNYCYRLSSGGAVFYNSQSSSHLFSFIRCNFTSNYIYNGVNTEYQVQGGALFLSNAIYEIKDCIFKYSRVFSLQSLYSCLWGAVACSKVDLTITDCLFDGNFCH